MLIDACTALCPLENTIYYRVKSPFRPDQNFKPLVKQGGFYIHEGLWFTHEVISLTFIEFIPKNRSPSKLFSLSLNSKFGDLYQICRDPPRIVLPHNPKVGFFGYADSVEPIPSSLCASYEVQFDSMTRARQQLPSLNLDCNEETSGKIIVYAVRLNVPSVDYVNGKNAANVLPLSELEISFSNGKATFSTRFNTTTRMLHPLFNPLHLPQFDVREPSNIFYSTDDSVLHPLFPDFLHRSLGISRDVIINDPLLNTQISLGYWLPNKWLKFSFHQVSTFGLYGDKGVTISLKQLQDWSNHKSKSNFEKKILTLLEKDAHKCNHINEGHFTEDHSEMFQKYFIDRHELCENDEHCQSIHIDGLEIKWIHFVHDSNVGRSFIGMPTLDKMGGRLYSYLIWIRRTDSIAIPDGQFTFEIENNQMVGSQPNNIMNGWGRRAAYTHSFASISTEFYMNEITQETEVECVLSQRLQNPIQPLEKTPQSRENRADVNCIRNTGSFFSRRMTPSDMQRPTSQSNLRKSSLNDVRKYATAHSRNTGTREMIYFSRQKSLQGDGSQDLPSDWEESSVVERTLSNRGFESVFLIPMQDYFPSISHTELSSMIEGDYGMWTIHPDRVPTEDDWGLVQWVLKSYKLQDDVISEISAYTRLQPKDYYETPFPEEISKFLPVKPQSQLVSVSSPPPVPP